MDCLSALTANIVSNCTTQGVGGAKTKAWLGARSEFVFTYDATNPSLITDIARVTGTDVLRTVNTVHKGLDVGHDREQADRRADRFVHTADLEIFETSDLDVREQIDRMQDMVLIYQRVDDGSFVVKGAKYGLYVTADTQRENNAQGARPITLASRAGETEPWSSYTYLDTDEATTLAALVAFETPAD